MNIICFPHDYASKCSWSSLCDSLAKFLITQRYSTTRSSVSQHRIFFIVIYSSLERFAYSWTNAPKRDGRSIRFAGLSNSFAKPAQSKTSKVCLLSFKFEHILIWHKRCLLLTCIYNQHSVTVHDCRYSVSNADNGARCKVFTDDLLNHSISLRIHWSSCLIQEQDSAAL